MLASRPMNATETIRITVNGEARDVPRGITVAKLLEQTGRTTAPVAVERNHEVVPRRTFHEAVLADGDRLELVAFVGGG